MNGVEEKAELAVCSNILVYAGAATTGRFAPKKVYAIGSMSTSDGLQWTNWVYDPVECTLSIVKPMSVQRTAFRMVAVDDFLYVIGAIGGIPVNVQYVPLVIVLHHN